LDPVHPPAPPRDELTVPDLIKQADPSWWGWVGGGVSSIIVIAVVVRLVRRRRDPRRAVLEKRADDLAAIARALGITVTPATTVSNLARDIGARTGIDLGPHLKAHLAARYGTGAVPPPWPLAELRAAMRRR
jgi:hypothetical protein